MMAAEGESRASTVASIALTASVHVRFGFAVETSRIVDPARMSPSMLITARFHAA